MSANIFLPQFKRSVDVLRKDLKNESQDLFGTFNKLMDNLGQSEAKVKESLEKFFHSLSIHFQNQGDHENWENLVKILDLVAKSEEGVKQEVNEIKELMKKEDNRQKQVGRNRLLNLLNNEAFIKPCANLICSKLKTKAERIKEINEGVSNSFNEIYNARVGQASYSEWGPLGVGLVQIIVGLVQKLAIEAGHDIPDISGKQPGIQRLMPTTPGKPPIILPPSAGG